MDWCLDSESRYVGWGGSGEPLGRAKEAAEVEEVAEGGGGRVWGLSSSDRR